MPLRSHEGIVFEKLKGLWDRGDIENVPLDHLTEAVNLISDGENITVRPGVGLHQSVAVPLEDVRRMYNYNTQTANTLIVLTVTAGVGNIYHVVDEDTVYGPILTITGMTDFAFQAYAGRGYISPFTSYTVGDLFIEKGLQNQFLYVYAGDGTAARKAGGTSPGGTLTVAHGAAGHTDAGMHVFAVVGETSSGFLSAPIAMKAFTTVGSNSVSFGTVPVFSGAQWVRRHIVASSTIVNYNGNVEGYQLFFLTDGTIENNTDTFKNNVSFYDDELLEDASHLFDSYAEIPAGAALSIYHDRLCVSATYTDISLILVSAEGEPENFSQIDGLIIVPLDGNPITAHQELRDVFYVCKRARTVSYTDNGDVPSSWLLTVVDNALGCPVHGIATVLDSGAASVDYLIMTTYAGIMLFTGKYVMPELTWKIQDFWFRQDRNEFRQIQIMYAPIQGWILCVLPDRTVLVGDTNNGNDASNIRWWPWRFNIPVNCLAIVNIDQIIIGSPIYTGI